MSNPWEYYAKQGAASGDEQERQVNPWEYYGKQGASSDDEDTGRPYKMSPIEVRDKFNSPEARAARRAKEQDNLVSNLKNENAIANLFDARSPALNNVLNTALPVTNAGVMAGFGKAFHDVGLAGQEMAGNKTYADAARNREDSEALMRSAPGKIGNTLGYAGMAIPLADVAPEALWARAALSGLGGLWSGLMTPYESNKEHLHNMAVGTALGGVLPVAGKVVGAAIKNSLLGLASPDARALLAQGVKLTPGQMLGGVAKATEDKATSIPLLGDAISNARLKSFETMNNSVINQILSKIGQALPKGMAAGRDAVEHANTAISDAYSNTLGQMKGVMDSGLAQSIGKIWQKFGSRITNPDKARELDSVIHNEVIEPFRNAGGQLSGQDYQQMKSRLGQIADDFLSSDNYHTRDIGHAVKEVQGSLKDMLARNNPTHLVDQLHTVDSAFADMVRLNRAAVDAASREGVFSAATLRRAIRAEDSTRGKAAYRAGNAPLQDFAETAERVLPNKVPDSGTAGRLFSSNAAGQMMGVMTSPLALLYSGHGMSMAKALLAPQQGSTRNFFADLMKSTLEAPKNSLLLPIFKPSDGPQQAPNQGGPSSP